MNLSVIIPSYRNPKYLDLCLKSIIDGQDNPQNIIVSIDGFPDESEWVMEKYDQVGFLVFEENRGMQNAINSAVFQADTEYVFIINDDNVFPPSWDTRLLPLLEENLVITVNQIEPTGPGMFHFPVCEDCGKDINSFDMDKFVKFEAEYTKRSSDISWSAEGGRVFPYVINKRWFMAVGGFDTYYNSPNIVDWDHFLKLELLPHLEFGRTRDLSLYHFSQIATKKSKDRQRFIMKEQFAYKQFEYKWGFPPYNAPDTNSKLRGGNVRGIQLR